MKATSFCIILAYAQVRFSASLMIGCGLLSIAAQFLPLGQSLLLSRPSRDRKGKGNGPFRVSAHSTQLCKNVSGGYLKCSGAVLPAPFEGLNEGLKG